MLSILWCFAVHHIKALRVDWHEPGIAEILGEQSSLQVDELKIQNCFGETKTPS